MENERCRRLAKKPGGLFTKNIRHFAFSRVFFQSESESKTPQHLRRSSL